MKDGFLQAMADRHHIPVPVAKEMAVEVAQRCALVANRYEPEGLCTMEERTNVEALGAKIGAAIIQTFSEA